MYIYTYIYKYLYVCIYMYVCKYIHGVVLPMNEHFIFFSFYFPCSYFFEIRVFCLNLIVGIFHSWEFWCHVCSFSLDFSRLQHIKLCADYCLWSTAGNFVKFVIVFDEIRYKWVLLTIVSRLWVHLQSRHKDAEIQRGRETDTGPQRHRDTVIQKHLNTKPQRTRDAET